MASLKARDIQSKLQHSHDPALVNILCAMAERDDVNHKQIINLAEAYDRLVNMFSTVMRGVGGMKMAHDTLMQKMGLSSAADSVKSIEEDDDQTNSTRHMDEKK